MDCGRAIRGGLLRRRSKGARRWLIPPLGVALAALTLIPGAMPAAPAWPDGPADPCNRFAAIDGDDAGVGTAEDPFRTAQKLTESLAPNEIGCLLGGTYAEDVTFTGGGVPGAPVTLRSAPGETAAIRGSIWVADSASDVTISHLILDGAASRRETVLIFGDRVTISDSDISNRQTGAAAQATCLSLGDALTGMAYDTVVERDHIHDCGTTGPSHGVMLERSRNARITDNHVFDAAGAGIRLHEDADGTLVERNVVDGSDDGLVIGGRGSTTSDDNVVRRNIFSFNSGHGVTTSWAGPTGTDNTVELNCFWGNGLGPVDDAASGFTEGANVQLDPLFASRAVDDFTLAPDSPCAAMGPGAQVEVAAVIAAEPPDHTTSPSVSGEAVVGKTLTAAPGTWTGTEPITYAFQWRRCDPAGLNCAHISGASGQTYTITNSDTGARLRILVTASNSAGSVAAHSLPTEIVTGTAPPTGVAPVNVAAPTITGAATVGGALAASAGTWTGTQPISVGYQWRRCSALGVGCVDIAGATGSAYSLTLLEVGATVRVAVTAANTAGQSTAVSAASPLVAASAPPPVEGCNLFAATTGTDAGTGAANSPFLTAQKLASTLAPGQSGCLRGGTYDGDANGDVLDLSSGGLPGAAITIRSYPGERGRLVGNVHVRAGADHVTLSGLDIEGTGDVNTVEVLGADFVLEDSDVTNAGRGRSCVLLGAEAGSGRADRPILRGNRLYGCGSVANGNKDHAVWAADSADGEIVENVVFDVAAYSVHLYPNAQGTLIARNVIDGGAPSNRGGLLIGGDEGSASSNNVAEHNIIAFAETYNVTSYWGGPVGTGNVVRNNCIWAGDNGNINTSQGGFAASSNTIADPLFVNRAAHDYRLQAGSPCAAMGPGGQQPPPPSAPNNTASPTISGTPAVGVTLTASTGTWSGTPPITFAYQWLRCDSAGSSCVDIAGATGQPYTVTAGDTGARLRVRVTASNITGSATAQSLPTTVVPGAPPPPAAPANTALPTVAGSPVVGQTLTAAPGTWTGTQPITLAYQWRRCNSAGASCADIAGAQSQTYILTAGDAGSTVRVRVTASNNGGSAEASSLATNVVTGPPPPPPPPPPPVAPANTALPTLAGTAMVGQPLSAGPGTWTGTQPITFTYQWRRCTALGVGCVDIAGATANNLTLTVLELGSTLRVAVRASNAAGQSTAVSPASAVVLPLPTPPATGNCARFAAPNGSDSNPGTDTSPYRTVSRLESGLAAGQTGCLKPGSYTENPQIDKSDITLTSAPGGRATIRGYLSIYGDDVTVTGLNVDGSPEVQNTFRIIGARAVVTFNDITNRFLGRSCLFIGSASEGIAIDPVVDRNTIHECGHANEPDGHQTHGIYNGFSRNARITNNVIWGAQFYGIQFWPDADGGLFQHNIVDGSQNRSGIVFGGEGGATSSNNSVRNNIITFNDRNGVTSSGSNGSGNVVQNNCLFGNGDGDFGGGGGYSQSANLHADPLFLNRLLKDFRLLPLSPCLLMGPR